MSTLLSNGFYDKLKFLALVVLPATAAAYFSLAGIWNLPNAQEVVGTITVIDTFLGVLLGIANQKYVNSDERFDGSLELRPDVENGLTDLKVSIAPSALESGKDEIALKVARVTQVD